MSRFWAQGYLVRIDRNAADAPQRIHWQGRWHTVDYLSRQWRIDVDWWHNRVWRDYYKVSTTSGLLIVVYHNRLNDRWYVQRLFD